MFTTIAAGGLGLATGDHVGAAAAFNSKANNRQLHPERCVGSKNHAQAFAKENGMSPEEAEQRLGRQAVKQGDAQWAGYLGSDGL